MTSCIEIDGSLGEGGGQVLRTSLALAAVTGTAVRIDNIRAGRGKPGLLRQHLTCARAIAEITGGQLDGAALGSTTLTLAPGPARAGDYHFSIGSAGSAGLVLQTVLWPLLFCDRPSRVVIDGGTHNKASPPFDFLATTFLPLLARMGARVNLIIDRHGFYPAGGGRYVCSIEPCAALAPIELTRAGPVRARRARALLSRLPRHIGERELATLEARVALHDRAVEEVASPGPGNALVLAIERDQVTEVITGFGERGVRAETVASRVADEAERYGRAGVPVGDHLADQLIVPLALAGGGAFRCAEPTPHTRTNIEVVGRFVDTPVAVTAEDGGSWRVQLG